MRQATFLRKKVSVSEKDYKRLLNRFDPKKLTVGKSRKISCPLCARFLVKNSSCSGCTFRKFYHESSGCCDLIERLLRSESLLPYLLSDSIAVETSKELKGVEKIHKILQDRFKRI